MGIPIDDDRPHSPTGDEALDDEPAPPRPSPDPEVPEADAVEQATELHAGWRVGPVSRDPEVPEADAIDQATELPVGDEFDA